MFPLDLLNAPTLPLAAEAAGDTAHWLSPAVILVLCVVAGVGTVLLLPGRREVAWRRLGGAVLLAAAAFFGVALFVSAPDRPAVYFWAFSAIALLGSVRVITHPKPVYSALYFVLTVFATAGLFVLLWAEFIAVALITIYAGAILVTYTFVIMLAADSAPAGVSGDDAARDFLAEHDRQARAPWSAAAVGFLTMGVLLFVIFDRAPRDLLPRQSVTDARFLQATPGEREVNALGLDAEREAGKSPDGAAPVLVSARPGEQALPVRGDLYPSNNQPSHAAERGGIQTLGIYLFTRQVVTLQVAGLILTVAMVGAIVIARRQIIPDLRPPGLAEAESAADSYATPHTPVDDNPHSLPVHGTGDARQKAYPQN